MKRTFLSFVEEHLGSPTSAEVEGFWLVGVVLALLLLL